VKLALYIGDLTMENGGAFMYARAVAKLLIAQAEVSRLVVLAEPGREEFFAEGGLQDHPKLERVSLPLRPLGRLLEKLSRAALDLRDIKQSPSPLLHRLGVALNPLRGAIDRIGADALHVPWQVAPAYGLRTPLVVSMHDVQELRFPEFFSSHARLYRALYHRRALAYADQIIVSFPHIKEDLVSYFQLPPVKIDICPIPLTGEWLSEGAGGGGEHLREHYRLPQQFMLYPAQTWKHKNHLRLFEAMALLRKSGVDAHLVCTGGLNDYAAELRSAIGRLGLEERVHFLNIIPAADLAGLYRIARLVVIPTLYEAGSAPLFEAMRYRTPVVCSRVTSLPESIGAEEFTFDPTDIAMMAEMIRRGLLDDQFRARNMENSERRLAYYRTFDYGARFLNAYRNAIAGKRSGQRRP